MNSAPTIKERSLADVVRRLRISQRLTKRDVAFLAGVDQQDIEKFENEMPLKLEVKLKILKILYSNRTHRI